MKNQRLVRIVPPQARVYCGSSTRRRADAPAIDKSAAAALRARRYVGRRQRRECVLVGVEPLPPEFVRELRVVGHLGDHAAHRAARRLRAVEADGAMTEALVVSIDQTLGS